MLLTGFDAPIEQVMYIDKKLKEHNLLQTIARVNRTYPGKTVGYIVDYIGLTENLQEALSLYSGEDQRNILDTFKSMQISGSSLVSNIAFYVIVVFVSITALNQAGVNTEIITSNLTLILGSVLVSFTIAFGLGARDIITRLLFGFYTRRNFEIGQHIKTKKIEGVIQEIDNICISIKTEQGIVIMPIKHFVDLKVIIK